MISRYREIFTELSHLNNTSNEYRSFVATSEIVSECLVVSRAYAVEHVEQIDVKMIIMKMIALARTYAFIHISLYTFNKVNNLL
ncbi:MAG: hypothetical protein QXL96_01785 [Ignisphaera sp.]